MMNKAIFTTFILMCMAALVATAQVTVSGSLTNEQGAAVEFANVVLVNASDSSYVQGTVTGEDGSFTLSDAPATGLLKVTMVGYQPLFHRYTSPQVGTLVMQPDARTLGEVTVTAQRPSYKLTHEGLMTSVQGTVLSQLGTAEDVLGMIPGLTVNSDGEYQVLGKGTPVFYLNGRKVFDIKQITSLSSQEIKDVEVIRNPGAKYDAAITAVVRITTVKRQGDGWGINVWGQYQYGKPRQQLTLPSLSWNYRTGGWDFFGTLYYAYTTSNENNRSYLEQVVRSDQLWRQEMMDYELWTTHTLNNVLGVNYSIDDNNSVGMKYMLQTDPPQNTTLNLDATVYVDDKYYDDLVSRSDQREVFHPYHTINAYYNGKAGKLGIDVNVDWDHSSKRTEVTTTEVSAASTDRVVPTVTCESNNLWAAKAVLSYPVWRGMLNAGVEATITRFNSLYQVDVDFLQSADTKLREWHLAPFVEYEFECKLGQFSAGVRYEHVGFNYYDAGVKQTDKCRRFNNVFPNVGWGFKLGQVMCQLSYAVRTHRIGYNYLGNTFSYINRYTMQRGNPTLTNETHHSLSAAAVWRWLQVAASYTDTRDCLEQVTQDVTGTDGAMVLEWVNWPSRKTLSVDLAIAPTVGKWSPRLEATMVRYWMSSGPVVLNYSPRDPLFEFKFNNVITLGNWMLHLNAGLTTRGDMDNARVLSVRNNVTIGVTRYLLNRSLIVRVKALDLFNKSDWHVLTTVGSATLMKKDLSNGRAVRVSVQYLFNTTRSKYKGTGAGNDEKNRL